MFDTTYATIEVHFEDNWTDTPVEYDNVPFTPIIGTPFVRLNVVWATNTPISIGGLNRGTGIAYFQIHTPKGTGTIESAKIATKIAKIFTNKSINKVQFSTSTIQRIGVVRSWYRLNVLIPFTVDECCDQ